MELSGRPAKAGRENNFGVLRLCAALMVIAGHMAHLLPDAVPTMFSRAIHVLGVYIFFLIGGYLITKSWMSDPHPVRYAVKRFMRIWPPLAVFVLFATFIAGPVLSTLPVSEYFASGGWKTYLMNLGLFVIYFLPGVFAGNPYPNAVNGSLWTLPVEVAMYIAVPILLTLTAAKTKSTKSKVGFAAVCAAVCALDCYMLAYRPGVMWVFYGTDWVSALHNIPFYLIGVLCAVVDVRKILNLQAAVVLALLTSCMNMSYVKMQIVLFFVLPYIVFSLAFEPKPLFRFLNDKAEISYGMYLYGFFVQQVVMDAATRLGVKPSFMAAFLVSSVLTAVAAYVSCLLVERPALRLCDAMLKRMKK